jgi:phosphorylase/glycogen(starch) synthase
MPYYDLLTGFDLTVYPSYYEPWGYTPLESIAFHIPTITTSLAGFAQWVNGLQDIDTSPVYIVERNDTNDKEVITQIANIINDYINLPSAEKEKLQSLAYQISLKALWKEMINNYYQAFDIAIKKAHDRFELFAHKTVLENIDEIIEYAIERPQWKKILVKTTLPDNLLPLTELANNLWWSWNEKAVNLFKRINPDKWIQVNKNPIRLIEELNFEELQKLSADKEFVTSLNEVYY